MKNNNKKGYAVLELLFYISIFAILILTIINAIIIMAKSFRETTIQAELMQGSLVMERISREIRQAWDIDSIATSSLVLDSKDQAGVNKTVGFSLVGSDIELSENAVLVGNLNMPNISILVLTFAQINTTEGKAVKVFLTFKSNNDKAERIQGLYNTVVLRGNYQ